MNFNKILPEALPDYKISRDIPSNDKALELTALIEKGAAIPDIGLAFLQEILPAFSINSQQGESEYPPIYKTGLIRFQEEALPLFLNDLTEEAGQINLLYTNASAEAIERVNEEARLDRINKINELLELNEQRVLERIRQHTEFVRAVTKAGGRFCDQKHDNQGRHAGKVFMDNVTAETVYVVDEMNRQLVARINEAERRRATLNQKLSSWAGGGKGNGYLLSRLNELNTLRRALLENVASRKKMAADAERTRYELLQILCTTDGVPEVTRHPKLPPLDPARYAPDRFEKAAEGMNQAVKSATESVGKLSVTLDEGAAVMGRVATTLPSGKKVRLKKDGTPWPTRKPAKKSTLSKAAAGKLVKKFNKAHPKVAAWTKKQGWKARAAAEAAKPAGRKGAAAKRGQKPVRLKKDGTPWGVRKPAKAK